ncbi:MAG: alpha/beta fold hydrolase [Myxococcaceae bacterium]
MGLALLALLAGAVGVRFALPAGTPRIRPRPGAGPTRSIALLEKLRIGGADQWVLQRSEDVRAPLLLFLHGGPGTSQLTANRRNTRALESHFVVVNWDQRGAGKSYRAIREVGRMNVEQFVQDTRELTTHLLTRFGQQRLVLVGHSWGSVIGALAASRHPDLYACYVGLGQIAAMKDGELASWRWTLDRAREARDRRAVRALEGMGPPPYSGDWQARTLTQRSLLARFGGEVHGSRTGAMAPVLGGLLFSREYGLVDRLNYFRGIFGSMRLLWPELMTVDLFRSAPRFEIPVLFMLGRHDQECPAELARRYFDVLQAPSKELVWFERSAHLPNTEERDAFNRALVDKVLPLARSAPGPG